jgi:hypothetical protein
MKLTMKTVPLQLGTGDSDYKVRLNEQVVELVHASVSRRWPGSDVGKRFAVEAVLRDWLRLTGEAELPTVMPEPTVPVERIRNGFHQRVEPPVVL